MLKSIFFFELKQGFKKPSTYIFFGIFFLAFLFLGMGLSGVFDSSSSSDSNIILNSASAITATLLGIDSTFLGLINSIVLITVMATAIYKDYEYNTHSLFFTKPLTKSGYFFGRFFGAFVITLFVFSGQILGYMMGCTIGSGNPMVGPFVLMNYLQPFLIFIVPNLLLMGVIYFSLTTFTRSTMSAYIVSIVVLALRTVSTLITSDIENKTIAAYLDPFGMEAFSKLTRYWTPVEQNNLLIPFQDEILYNRLLWAAVAIAITYFSYKRFSFSQFLVPLKTRRNKDAVLSPASGAVATFQSLPIVKKDFSFKAKLRSVWYLAKFEFKKISKSIFFLIVCSLAVIIMVLINFFSGQIFGTETFPVTYKMVESGAGSFNLFVIIIIIILSGLSLWRERDNKLDELVGASPVSNSVIYFSKYLALTMLVGLVMLVIAVTGIILQVNQNYYHLELGQYFTTLFLIKSVKYIILIGFCLFIQTIFSNKYIGFFVSCAILMVQSLLYPFMEWNNLLYVFNSDGPVMQYSDMNGYGHYLPSFYLVKLYWFSFILLLTFFGLKFMARGKEKGLKARYRLSKHANAKLTKMGMSLSFVLFLALGSFIFYNIKVLNKIITPKQLEGLQADFEKKYKKYQNTLQPRIVESNVKVNIFPENRSFEANGFFYLKNKHSVKVDTLIIGFDPDYTYTKLSVSCGSKTIVEDKELGLKVWKLNAPINPGDSVKLEFALEKKPKGFKNDSPDMSVVYNGTFFNSDIFPTIGYNSEAELSSNTARKKHGLKAKPRMANVNDSLARRNTYISADADWIRFEAVVSTSEGQIAIAPGYLQKEWKESGRNYYHYKMDSPILNFYAFLSAKYEIKKDKWINPADPSKPVNIEIYYQKGHEYNLDQMIKGIKKSLDYYTKNFSPYQHRQVRILEFPRYATFAQSFPNTIPFSEGIGFIAKVDYDNPESIDYTYYVTAHEVAHQWWAHQVIGGNVQGGTLMSETMSQYAALMVMEEEYGPKQMKKFLEYEMNSYLKGRALEGKKELPLMLVENQQYIHYSKGSVVMYALKDYIGEDSLNAALRKYIKKVAYQEAPYTNSIEFIGFLKDACPDSLKYIIKDMFEDITVYENYVQDLSYEPTKDGKYKVKLTLGSAKFKADSLGKQKKVMVADYIDVGVFSEKDVNGKKEEKELIFKKIKMDKDLKTFEFIVDEKPIKAGIDPYCKLVDRKPENNTWKFGSKPPKVSTDAGDDNLMIMLGGD